MSLTNKVALVTGASSGIGAAIAIKLTEEGARVAIVDRNESKLKDVSDTCAKLGNKPLTIVANLCKDEDLRRIVTETINFFERLDILVNNAGIWLTGSILGEKAIETYDKIINTNLRAVVYLTHLAAKHIVDSKGNIVNITSIAALSVMATNNFSYCTSKAGLDHFSRSIALELAAKGVRVNTINPGPVKTNIIENSGVNEADADHMREMLKKSTALERIADAKEVADLVAFVVSDKARSITGASIVTDNGILLKGIIEI